MGAGRSQKGGKGGKQVGPTVREHNPAYLLDSAHDFTHFVGAPSVVAERVHFLLVTVRTGKAERRWVACDAVHQAEQTCAGGLRRTEKRDEENK
jgi:hypothetical protein